MCIRDRDSIHAKVAAYEWHEMPVIESGGDRWAYGADMEYMKELCAYWLDGYDWRRTEAQLNGFDNYTAEIDGLPIHFIIEEGSGDTPAPLLMTHGWPGSVLEFAEVIQPLAHPERFGGKAEDGLTIICPSLPGYGFSGKPPRPLGPRTVAAMWNTLMRETLGFESYIAQGGDWGSVITALLGLHHGTDTGGGCRAIHLNMYGLRGDETPETPEEKAWAERMGSVMQAESAYLQLQGTKPQSLSYAMMDSPVGVCAWIVEKFHGWSDIKGTDGTRHLENRYTKDQLLSNVMLYLTTRSFNTATWIYRGFFEEQPRIPAGKRIEVPVGIGNFAEPYFAFPPRRMVEHSHNVVHWSDYTQAGHFAALEDGEQFVREIRSFLSALD